MSRCASPSLPESMMATPTSRCDAAASRPSSRNVAATRSRYATTSCACCRPTRRSTRPSNGPSSASTRSWSTRQAWGDGRPGYAWYFGRDACWTALAALAAGDFSLARLALGHLGDTQDVTGKVIHELTTSGLAHYDAADSTPLFLLLAGRYVAWTGDLPFLEERWPELERAYAFCLTTDRDRDGLIENAGVGHGWLEMGPLAGAKTSLYLASVWLAALESLAPVAQALGKESLAAELTERATRARAAVATRFLVDGGVALGIE